MENEIIYYKGEPCKPLVIFIHGLGMDASFWADPANARVLGGKYRLRILLPKIELKNSFDDLRERGYSVLSWSQTRPAGEAMIAFGELLQIASKHTTTPMILIGHSRGGLLARMFIDKKIKNILAVITIGAPHHGSNIARWAERLSPFASTLKRLLDSGKSDKKNSPIKKILSFLSSPGLKEMLPDSDLICSLPTSAIEGIKTVSIGGTDPSFIKLEGKTIIGALSGMLPDTMLPDELREGMGDGMVSVASSVWPGGTEHRNFHAHHAALPFDKDVRKYILEIVSSLN